MTACELMREQFVALADGELSEEDVARLETHLRECDGCREEYRAITGVLQAAEVWQLLSSPLTPPVREADLAHLISDAVAPLVFELRMLREEVTRLRAEVGFLRRDSVRNETGNTGRNRVTSTHGVYERGVGRPEPPELLPYAPPVEADLFVG